jgi:uncharacterized repeat protein (TIGR03803 family)
MRMLRNSARILGAAFIFSLTLSAQTFATLYNFCTQAYGACAPLANIILGPQGEVYGIAGGGRWNLGTVYELLPPSSPEGIWTEVVLHSFNGRQVEPEGGLTMGPNGSLFGLAESPTGFGMAFKLDPPTGASTDWVYAVIYQFTEADGEPYGPLVFGSPLGYGQSMYGITYDGGGNGAVYRLTPPPVAGGAWTHTTLYTFPGGPMGSNPTGSLAVGAGGALFGVTSHGGYVGGGCADFGGCGIVFSLVPPAVPGDPWREQVLHAFNPGTGDGSYPAGVVIGPGGVLYGATASGGGAEGAGGTVFSLTPPTVAGAPMTETILHSFIGFGDEDGFIPGAPPVLGLNGVLYGTTALGGTFDYGTVFELVPPASLGGSWTETVLHSFTGGADGNGPQGLALPPGGTLYGTTYTGGSLNAGTLFALTP